MNGNYRRFMHLINAAATGLLQQIPVVGPMLQAVLAQMDKEDLGAELQRLSRLLETGANLTKAGITAEQLEHDLIVINEQDPRLSSIVVRADAEAGNRLAGQDAPPGGGEVGNALAGQNLPQGRFLYLAAKNYATATRTAQIVADLGFLWRSYHAEGGEKIPHVGEIRVGDLIALAYRSPGQFRLLLPLIVIASGEHTEPINDDQCPRHAHAPHAPFVLADKWLAQILRQERFTLDPVFKQHSGLHVKLLPQQVLQKMYPSPGMLTIWPHDQMRRGTTTYCLPSEVRKWIGDL